MSVNFVSSLLQAIVRLDGDAVVLHVGERPYIVTGAEPVNLASKVLTQDAAAGILQQLLPAEAQSALEEFGAVQYQLPPVAEMPGELFTIAASRSGDDIWIELRRRRSPTGERVPLEMFERISTPPPPAPPPAAPPPPVQPAGIAPLQPPPFEPLPPTRVSDWALPPPAAPLPPEPYFTMPAAGPWPPAPPAPRPPAPVVPIPIAPPAAAAPPVQEPAVVLPLTRSAIRAEAPPPPVSEQAAASLQRLLRLAAARGASAVYLASGAQPSIRLDGDVEMLDGTPILEPRDVKAMLLSVVPERAAEALRSGAGIEWVAEIADLGRVRCTAFRDTRGPGAVFRLVRSRGVSADELGLTREIQSLALESDGLVLITGRRGSGKRTLIAALVDLINRSRRGHVITIESEINIVHERREAFVSQREVRGPDETVAAARAALREDPDVVVLESVRTLELFDLALDAAACGHLVIAGFPAPSASGAIDRIADLYPAEARRQLHLSLAQSLRGVVAQALLRLKGGGRVAARELLLNSPIVRSVLADGKTAHLPVAIESGRIHGMAPLNEALVGYVQSGMVEAAEAYRRAGDRPGFLELLKRQGLDTSALEKYA